MSDISRSDIQLIASILGIARQSLVQGLGDTITNPGALLDLETVFIRLRGSTIFHDTDGAANSLHFNSDDPVGLGILEAFFAPITTAYAGFIPSSEIPDTFNWYPGYDGPPCTEGWGIVGYNAWNAWRPSPLSSLSEVNSALRLTYHYPVHYDITSHAYSEVHMFDRARFVSLQNMTGGSITSNLTSFAFSVPVDQLQGCRIFNLDGTPYDVRIYTDPALIQSYDTGTNKWGAIGSLASNTLLTQVAYSVALSDDKSTYDFIVNMPMNITWLINQFWHFVLYWGSVDPYLDTITSPAFSAYTTVLGSQNNITLYLWPTKNFFVQTITDSPAWDQRGSYGPVLTAVNQTHYVLYDGQYNSTPDPLRYSLPTSWPGALSGLSNHLAAYTNINVGSAAAIRIVVYTQASQGYTVPQILIGPEIFPDFFPDNWGDCDYFPVQPDDTLTLALLIVKRPPARTYNLQIGSPSLFNPFVTDTAVYSNLSIIWSRQTIPTYALPLIGDPVLVKSCLSPLYRTLNKFRSVSFDNIISQIAFSLLVPALGEPSSLAPNLGALADPAGFPATLLHNFIKFPATPLLMSRPSDEPLAIPFDTLGHAVIYNLTKTDPSTEFMRLESDSLTITNNKLFSGANFELYMDTQTECVDLSVSSNSGGINLGWDYMLRLELVDSFENTLIKDWPIMASQFFLSDEQMALRQANGQTTVGYFTAETINNIDIYRLQGYAGLVPDITAGKSRPLNTQMVAPPDATKTTVAQFIASRQLSGETQAQIREDILEYQEDGNDFYIVDTAHYPNYFTALNSVGVTVTQYTYNAPYWAVNIDYYFGLASAPQVTLFFPAPEATLPSGDDISLNATAEGISITLPETSDLYELSIELKTIIDPTNHTGGLTNDSGAHVTVSLHADNSGAPATGAILTSTDTVLFSDLTTSYQEITFGIIYTLSASTQYWIVVTPSEVATGGSLNLNSASTQPGGLQRLSGGVWSADTGTAWLKLYAVASPRADSFTIAQSNLAIGAVETYGNQTQTVLPTDQYTSNTGFNFGLNYQTESILVVPNQHDWSVNETSLRLKITNTTGATPIGSLSLAIYTSIVDPNTSLDIPGQLLITGGSIDFSAITSSYAEYKVLMPVELFANTKYHLVITQSPVPTGSPAVIVYMQSSTPSSMSVNECLFYDTINTVWSADVSNSANIHAQTGTPWMQFYSQNPFILAAFNRSSSNITQYLPPPNTVRSAPIYNVESTLSYTSKSLPVAGPISIYPRAINTGSWEYVRFSQDIYYIVRAMVGGEIIDAYGVCNAAADSDPAPSEILLNIGNVEQLIYFGIGKAFNDIHTATHGAPSSDLLVLRSV